MNEETQNQSVENNIPPVSVGGETAIVELDLTFKPEVFDPNKEQLRAIAAEVAKIEADPAKMDKDTLELINTTKNKLVKARTRIQKIGKAQREPATKYAKEVKAYEDELLAILAPEEARMKDLEKAAKEKAMRDERMKTLPEFKEKLATIGDDVVADDDFLLSLDPNQRDQYYNERLQTKLQADQAAAEEAKRQEEAAKNEERQKLITARREIMLEIGFKPDMTGLILDTIDGTIGVSDDQIHAFTESEFATESTKWRQLADAKKAADIKATEERAKEEERKAQEQRAAEEEAKRQAEEKAEQERKAQEAAKAEQARKEQEAQESYQKWLSDCSYNAENDVVREENGVYVLYRKISTYEPHAFGFEPKNDV